MSNNLTINESVSYAPATGSSPYPVGANVTYTMATTSDLAKICDSQTIGTSDEDLDIGDFTDDCYLEVWTEHASAVLTYSVTDGVNTIPVGTTKKGQPPIRIPIVDDLTKVKLKASVACTMYYRLFKIAS